MIVYFELHCISEDKMSHEICNIQIKKDAVIVSKDYNYDITILKDVSEYDYDFSFLVDLSLIKTLPENKYLDEKLKEVKKIVYRKHKIKNVTNRKNS